MLNDLAFFNNPIKQNAAIYDIKEVFGENVPYIIEKRLGGKVIIFNDHFIRTAREAMTTGCMAKMNEQEVLLFERFVKYEDGSSYRDITNVENEVVAALDQWFMDDLRCNAHPVVNQCFDATTHTYTSCTN